MKTKMPVTIDDMEATAKDDTDNCSSYKIRRNYLTVEYMLDDTFNYRYANKIITKDEAESWLLNQ